MAEIEQLYDEWCSASSKRAKEKVLLKVFKAYEPLGYTVAKRYKCFELNDEDDWWTIVQIGIVHGMEEATCREDVKRKIYNRVRFHANKEVQRFTAKKTLCVNKVDYDVALKGVEHEEGWITKLDIQRAVEQLPPAYKKAITLWMSGLPVLPDKYQTCIEGYYSICEALNLKDAAVYFKLQDCFTMLRPMLSQYRETFI